MTIAKIKKEMLGYIDFYGGDIPQTDDIKNAKTKSELREILESYHRYLRDQNIDAMRHLENFEKKCGLTY